MKSGVVFLLLVAAVNGLPADSPEDNGSEEEGLARCGRGLVYNAQTNECEESVSVQLKKRDCPAGSVWQSELQSCVDPKTGEVVSDSSGSRVSSGSKQNNQENEPASPTVEDIKEQKKKCKANGGFLERQHFGVF